MIAPTCIITTPCCLFCVLEIEMKRSHSIMRPICSHPAKPREKALYATLSQGYGRSWCSNSRIPYT